MRYVTFIGFVVSMAALATSSLAIEFARELGIAASSSPSPVTGGCGTLRLNSDSTYENGYGWSYGGNHAPDWGAFAECYPNTGGICALVFDLTQVDQRPGTRMDGYVWMDDGGIPGAVLCLVSDVDPGTIAMWPSVSRHVVPLSSTCCVSGFAWVGYWGNWPGFSPSWYVAADLDGPGGCPKTHIYPGLGVPSGWQNVSVVWEPTAALGLGLESVICHPVATHPTTWGRIKSIYQ